MAITFVSSTTTFVNPNSPVGDAWRFTIPAGFTAGDVLLFCLGSSAGASSLCHVVTPGWVTPLFFRGDDNDLVIVTAFQLTGAETSPMTVTFSEDLSITEGIAVALLYRGAALPAAASASSAFVSGTGTSFPCPGKTPTVTGQRYVGIAHINADPTAFDSTPATQRFLATGSNGALAVFDFSSTSTDPIAAQSCVAHTAGEAGSAHSLLLPVVPPPVLPGVVSGAGDLALVLPASAISLTRGGIADLALISAGLASGGAVDLASDEGLTTAALISLGTDRRAEPDDQPPSGLERDRRGWWADEFADVEGDLIGSRLWLLDRAKITNGTALSAEEFTREALAWMLDDRVVSRIDVTTAVSRAGLLIDVTLQRPARDPVSFRFAHVWDAIT